MRGSIFLMACCVRSIWCPPFSLFLQCTFHHRKHLCINLKRVSIFLGIHLIHKVKFTSGEIMKLSYNKLFRRNHIFSTERNFYNKSGLNYNKKSWWNNEIIFNTFCAIIFKITNNTFNKCLRIICWQKLCNSENLLIKICKNSLRTMGVCNNCLLFIPFKKTLTKLQ